MTSMTADRVRKPMSCVEKSTVRFLDTQLDLLRSVNLLTIPQPQGGGTVFTEQQSHQVTGVALTASIPCVIDTV